LKIDELFQFRTLSQAISLQRDMASRVVPLDDSGFKPRLMCGMDVAYDGDVAFVAAVVWDSEQRKLVEKAGVKDKAQTKYVSGFLGFREGPLLVRIARKLRSTPDLFLVDGQGVAHPRRFGLASHFGLAIEKPTVGIAKSLLYGKNQNELIVDPEGHGIGRIMTANNGRKFYVSVGHRISLETASRLAEGCMVDDHPWPLREAHLDSVRMKRSATL
jgi:deoxyribonuclease V